MGPIDFSAPLVAATGEAHLDAAAACRNTAATSVATEELLAVLDGVSTSERILLKAAAGAGKSYALKRMVSAALEHERCDRIAVAAFANKQLYPLAEDLGKMLGADRVCLFTAKDRLAEIPDAVREAATVEADYKAVPPSIEVVIATSHKLESGLQWLPRVFSNRPMTTGISSTSSSSMRPGNFHSIDTGRSGALCCSRSESVMWASSLRSIRLRTRGAATAATTRFERGRLTTTTTSAPG